MPATAQSPVRGPVKRAVAAGVLVALGVSPAAALFGGQAAAAVAVADERVTINGFRYGPGDLRVEAGHTVTWTNADDAPHTVTTTSGPQAVASPELTKGDSFRFAFTSAGTYEYTCALHPDMAGSVVVVPASAAVSGPAPTPAEAGAPDGRAPPTAPAPTPAEAGPGGDAVPTGPGLASAAAAQTGPLPAVTTVVTRSTGISPLLFLVALTAAVAVFGALCFTARRPSAAR